MLRKNTLVFILILMLFGFALWAILPLEGERLGRQGVRLGLDLVGGVHLVYQAQFPQDATGEERANDMERALITIERRINKYGVTEPVIQRLGIDRILVQLPGFTDIETAKSLVEQTGYLEFRQVELNDDGQPVTLNDYLVSTELEFFDKGEQDNRIFVDEEGYPVAFLVKDKEGLKFTDEEGNLIDTEKLELDAGRTLTWIPARGDDGIQLTGDFLKEAVPTVSQDVTPEPQVAIEWNNEGAVIFDQIAKRLYNSGAYGTAQRSLGIFLDNTRLSAPQILEPAYHGSGVITGDFTIEEVDRLATLLKSGALPMPLHKPPLYQEKVSATLGANFIDKSVRAGTIGIILVMLFMMAYYRLSGVLASLALIFYGALVLALFKLIPVTLTLAGLGGFVLSIGMAVDANVLIFERMKEELRTGRTLGAAIEAGFNRAWTAIRDSNITTFIVCLILYMVGNNIIAGAPVKGFALTLFIGVAVSMFTAIVVTRTLLRLFVGTPLAKHTSLFSADWGKKHV
ncbi:protein translocase subunit SecD [Chloroflexota bacterium]